MGRIRKAAAVAMLACIAACAAETTEEDVPGAATPAARTSPPVPEAAPGGAAVPVPETVEIEGVGTCRRVGDLLFAGQPSPEGLRALAAQGYRTVLNTRGEGELDWDEKAEAEALGMRYVEIPMAYPIESVRDEWVERFDALMTGADRPILAHCSSGNRVAGLWAVWLAERGGVAPDAALALGRQAGLTRMGPVVERRLQPGDPE